MSLPQNKKLKSTDDRSLELMSMGRVSSVSKSGIAKLRKAGKGYGLPFTFDRSAQFRARKKVCQTKTPYGKLVGTMPFADGVDDVIAYHNTLVFFFYSCQQSPRYADDVRGALDRHPCRPGTP